MTTSIQGGSQSWRAPYPLVRYRTDLANDKLTIRAGRDFGTSPLSRVTGQVQSQYFKFPITAFIGTLLASYAHFLPVYDYQRSSCRRWRSKWQTACSRIISGSYRGPQRTANDSA
jgi:hypothetical protein